MYVVSLNYSFMCLSSLVYPLFGWREICCFFRKGGCRCPYQLCHKECWIQPGEACSGIYHLQMSSSLEILWSRKNQCLWSSRSNDWFCYKGTKMRCCLVYVCINLVIIRVEWLVILIIRMKITTQIWHIGYLIRQPYYSCSNKVWNLVEPGPLHFDSHLP